MCMSQREAVGGQGEGREDETGRESTVRSHT